MNLLFSVVIPTYNRRALLTRCLEALRVQTLEPDQFEVIVVDDGSTDGTYESIASASFPFAFRVIRTENRGASRARNKGIVSSGGQYVAFTEDDVTPEPDWLKAAAAHMILNPKIDVLEGQTVYEETGEGIRRFDEPGVPSFIPCNLFVRREVFDRLGGYDAAFYDPERHLYFREDADLGFRLLDGGCYVFLAPDVIVRHPVQFNTLAAAFHHARRYFFDPLLYRKHPVRFRRMIEVKKIFGITFHRPQHIVATIYLAMLIWTAAALIQGIDLYAVGPATAAFCCSLLFRYKYQGRDALRLYNVKDTIGFLFVPLVYLAAVIRGAIRYRVFGVLFP